jgi:O-antigen ligase
MNTNELALGKPPSIPVNGETARGATWPYRIALFVSLFGLVSFGADEASGGGSFLRQLGWLVLALWGLPGLISIGIPWRWRGVRNRSMLLLGLILAYCLLSGLWSELHLITIKRALLLLLVASVACASFGRKTQGDEDFIGITAAPLFLLLILSFCAALVDPSWAITPVGWRGVTEFKNTFGMLSAMSLLCALCLLGRQPLRYGVPLVLLSAAGLVLSQSATSLVAAVLALALGATFLLFQHQGRWRQLRIWVLGLSMLVLLTMFLIFASGLLPSLDSFSDKLFSLLGKSTTLTGRTRLWTLVLSNARYHNDWLGGGYGGFWNGVDSPAAYTGWWFGGGYVGEAHNGYIDLYNDLGYLGLVGLAVFLLTYLRNILAPSLRGSREFYFHFCFVIFLLVHNYAESTLFRSTYFLNVLMLASYIRVAALSFHAKARP